MWSSLNTEDTTLTVLYKLLLLPRTWAVDYIYYCACMGDQSSLIISPHSLYNGKRDKNKLVIVNFLAKLEGARDYITCMWSYIVSLARPRAHTGWCDVYRPVFLGSQLTIKRDDNRNQTLIGPERHKKWPPLHNERKLYMEIEGYWCWINHQTPSVRGRFICPYAMHGTGTYWRVHPGTHFGFSGTPMHACMSFIIFQIFRAPFRNIFFLSFFVNSHRFRIWNGSETMGSRSQLALHDWSNN